MYRFFVNPEQILENEICITGKDVNHIKNVLRMKVGQQVLISNGQDREYTCAIEEICPEKVLLSICDIDGPERELSVQVTLFQGLPKSDKMEMIIQKMVELGAYEIVPVATKRCVVKLDEKKAAMKTKRWNAIAESAAKQSKRGIIPEVTEPISFRQALEKARTMDMLLIPYEEAENMQITRKTVSEIKSGMSIGKGHYTWQTYFENGNRRDGIDVGYYVFNGRIERKKMEAYFDNSATTKVTESVKNIVVKTMTEDFGNPSSMHMVGVKAERYVKEAKHIIANILKVDEGEIYFTSGGTESIIWRLLEQLTPIREKETRLSQQKLNTLRF